MNRPLAVVGAIAGAALVLSGLQVAGAGSASANPAGSGLVISEVFANGEYSGAPYDADFVELYNPTSTPINLSGKSLQARSAYDRVLGTVPLSGTVSAQHAFLVQMNSAGTASASHKDLPTPDLEAGSGGGSWVDLVANGVVILGTAGSYPTGDLTGAIGVTDAVGALGSGSYETAAAPTGDQFHDSLQRAADGGDSDDNATDFSWAGPSPCNASCTSAQLARSSSTVSMPAVTATSGMPATPPVTVTGSDGTPTGWVTLTSDDPGIGYPFSTGAVPLDASGTAAMQLPDTLSPGTYTFAVWYDGDATYRSGSAIFTLTVTAPAGTVPTTVAAPDASTGVLPNDDSPGVDELVTLASTDGGIPTGVVTIWKGDIQLVKVNFNIHNPGSDLPSGTESVRLYALNLDPGPNTLTLKYLGNDTYAPSTGTFKLTVPLPSVDSTTTVIAPSTTYGTAGRASVNVAASGTTVAGDVTLTGAGNAQTKPVDADGNVTFDLPATLAAGTYSLTASYAGTDGVNPSTGTATFTVAAISTGGSTVQPPAGDTLTPAQQKLKRDQAKLKKVKKKVKKAHGAKKVKLQKKMKKLKKTVKKDKKLVEQGK